MALFVIDLSACELTASRQNSNLTASSNVKLVVANGKDKLNLKTATVNITVSSFSEKPLIFGLNQQFLKEIQLV